MAKRKVAAKAQADTRFQLKFLNEAQEQAYELYKENQVLFLLGPAGCGKTHLASEFAIHDILMKYRRKIVLTRPTVEAGEKLGYLPGDLMMKMSPYMRPMNDCIAKCVPDIDQKEYIEKSTEVFPLAFMRGVTFDNSVCILDEAQNTSVTQLTLFLSRIGKGSKMIITGDPLQSDIPDKDRGLMTVVRKLTDLKGVGIHWFDASTIVRNSLIASILHRLGDK